MIASQALLALARLASPEEDHRDFFPQAGFGLWGLGI